MLVSFAGGASHVAVGEAPARADMLVGRVPAVVAVVQREGANAFGF